jgi:hypothetical protein
VGLDGCRVYFVIFKIGKMSKETMRQESARGGDKIKEDKTRLAKTIQDNNRHK